MQLKSLGAGNPDWGLFTSEQFDRRTNALKDQAAPERRDHAGRGRTEARAPSAEEQAVWGAAPPLDVYLNEQAYWKNVPHAVWDFTIGGYQVIKKWLSYREQRVLGRALTMGEIMEVTATAASVHWC
jgi:hypothetical protein